jgi:hypothetical protein
MRRLTRWTFNFAAVTSLPAGAIAAMILQSIAQNGGIPRSSIWASPDHTNPSEPAWPQPVAMYVGVCSAVLAISILCIGTWCALTVRQWRQQKSTALGHCLKCGYDLRATPDRCSECGTPATASAKQARP